MFCYCEYNSEANTSSTQKGLIGPCALVLTFGTLKTVLLVQVHLWPRCQPLDLKLTKTKEQ
eukprot:971662-Amphidinium_carterae.1